MPTSDSHVINLEDQPSINLSSGGEQPIHNHHHQTTVTNSFLNSTWETANQNINNSNNNNNNNNGRAAQITTQMQQLYRNNALLLCLPFMPFIIKVGYDYRHEISNLSILHYTFDYANASVKREIAKQQNRSWISLMSIICYISLCIGFIALMSDLYTLKLCIQPITFGELLFSVIVTDYVLKLITVIFKVIITCLPVRFLAFQDRGRYYFMIEATSQLIRCIAPIHSWLYYLFETYRSSEKIFGICLFIAYAISKGATLPVHITLFYTAVWKLLQNRNIGVALSKEQLLASDKICAICQDEYSKPIRLHCKHIFCEVCVSMWLDRERSCPLCRAPITDHPIYRDGHTTCIVQLH